MAARNSASDLIDEREYDAPRELLFECWTVAEHFARWFAPRGVEVARCELDARPGGRIRFQHRFTSSARVVSIRGVYDEVVPPERLQLTFTFVDADDRPIAPPVMPDWPVGVHIVMTVEMHETPRGTRMSVYQRVAEPDAAGTPPVVRHHELAGEGWRQTAERLVAYLAERRT